MKQVALALGSGGARGWCHIGVLRALEAQGVLPMAVAGCSIGALVGAAWAANRLDELERTANALTQKGLLNYLDPRFETGGVLGGQGVELLFRELDLPERIEDLAHPFMTVATDLATGKEVWLREGPLIPAVRASLSIPGMLKPVETNGSWLIDGGVVNPVPVSAARALGGEAIIAVNPNGRGGKPHWAPEKLRSVWQQLGAEKLHDQLPKALTDVLPDVSESQSTPRLFDVLDVTIDILVDYVLATRSAVDPPDVLLEANLSHFTTMDLFRAREAIEEGLRITKDAADQISRAVA